MTTSIEALLSYAEVDKDRGWSGSYFAHSTDITDRLLRSEPKITDLLSQYDELQPSYVRVSELKDEAGEFPDLYTEADELQADLNESARDILDLIVKLLREES